MPGVRKLETSGLKEEELAQRNPAHTTSQKDKVTDGISHKFATKVVNRLERPIVSKRMASGRAVGAISSHSMNNFTSPQKTHTYLHGSVSRPLNPGRKTRFRSTTKIY